MNVESRPLAEIKPHEQNPRISDAAVEAVAESFRRFGFRQPIVVDEAGVSDAYAADGDSERRPPSLPKEGGLGATAGSLAVAQMHKPREY